MDITNLLAQGYQPRQIEPYGNALMRVQDFKTKQQQNALLQMQGEDMHAQRALALQQAQQASEDRARLEQWRQSIPSPQMAAQQQALAGGGGPTVDNAVAQPAVDPRLQMLHRGLQAGVVSPADYFKHVYPDTKVKDYKPVRNPDGSVSLVGLTEDGRVIKTGQQPFEKPEVKSFGDFMGGIDPITGKVTRYGVIGQSADNAATVGATLAGQRSVAATAAAGRAQSDRHFQSGLDQPEYKQQEDGTWIALPKKAAMGGPIVAQPVTGADGKPLQGMAKPLTEGQAKATKFSARMADASTAVAALEAQGVSSANLRTKAAGSDWTNWLASAEGQQYKQAASNWLSANLRDESGAAIGILEENKDYRKFFPQLNDDPGTIAQKARSRRVAEEAMLAEAGPGAKMVRGILQKSGGAAGAGSGNAGSARPQAGAVVDGFRFKGGNPADKANWEKQ